ncbi:MAG: hypothetical protein GC191_00965 [Azospirillum sp.]|nr:hypothetical protein [Azospirillum sp.]
MTAASAPNKDANRLILVLLGVGQRVLRPVATSYDYSEPDKFCTREMLLRPISRYGIDKLEAEGMVREPGNAIRLCLATVSGTPPRIRLDLLVSDLVCCAANDRVVVLFEPRFRRSFLPVGGVARTLQHGIAHFDRVRDEGCYVGWSDANLSKAGLCEFLGKYLPGFDFPGAGIDKDVNKRDCIGSNDNIESTGYCLIQSLDMGIVALIQAYQMILNSIYGDV